MTTTNTSEAKTTKTKHTGLLALDDRFAAATTTRETREIAYRSSAAAIETVTAACKRGEVPFESVEAAERAFRGAELALAGARELEEQLRGEVAARDAANRRAAQEAAHPLAHREGLERARREAYDRLHAATDEYGQASMKLAELARESREQVEKVVAEGPAMPLVAPMTLHDLATGFAAERMTVEERITFAGDGGRTMHLVELIMLGNRLVRAQRGDVR